jgi:pyridoxal phosphate enzyme (YggS family)
MSGPAVEERLAALVAEIRSAERQAGRAEGSVELLGVTKGQPPELVLEATAAGLQSLGENYVQECAAKERWLRQAGAGPVSWHLLGHLQRNKARRAAGLFRWIESLDSLELARLLSAARAGSGPLIVLCEVELTQLPGRNGFEPDRLEREWEELLALDGIAVQGLMTVAAPGEGRRAFAACRSLAERLVARGGRALPTLSMGMSADFRDAIAEGSTRVRIGSLLFGDREPHPA